jgi:RNA polymerase sigma-70 factor (ECF subfamily)
MRDCRIETQPSDEWLVDAVLGGDVSAFGALVERHWRVVVALALSRISDPAEAEDIAQESFLKAYSQLRTLRDPHRFAGWLSKITMQQCANAIRRDIRHKVLLVSDPDEAAHTDAIPAYSPNPGMTEAQIRFVRQAVGRLPQRLQRLIIMRFTTGLSAVQIAEQLGKRPGTVRVWLHRAYKILRAELNPLLEEVEP